MGLDGEGLSIVGICWMALGCMGLGREGLGVQLGEEGLGNLEQADNLELFQILFAIKQ